MRRRPLSSLKQISDINLTPLMDLTFILLITFIITFPLIEQGIDVSLPEADASEVAADEARSITIDRQGNYYLEDIPLSPDELRARLHELAATAPDVHVMVRADEAIAYGRVVFVLKMLHAEQLTRVALVTEAETR